MEIVAEGDICYPKEESQQALFASHNNNHRLIQSKKDPSVANSRREEGGAPKNPGPGAFSGMCTVRTCKLVSKENALSHTPPTCRRLILPLGSTSVRLGELQIKVTSFQVPG